MVALWCGSICLPRICQHTTPQCKQMVAKLQHSTKTQHNAGAPCFSREVGMLLSGRCACQERCSREGRRFGARLQRNDDRWMRREETLQTPPFRCDKWPLAGEPLFTTTAYSSLQLSHSLKTPQLQSRCDERAQITLTSTCSWWTTSA